MLTQKSKKPNTEKHLLKMSKVRACPPLEGVIQGSRHKDSTVSEQELNTDSSTREKSGKCKNHWDSCLCTIRYFNNLCKITQSLWRLSHTGPRCLQPLITVFFPLQVLYGFWQVSQSSVWQFLLWDYLSGSQEGRFYQRCEFAGRGGKATAALLYWFTAPDTLSSVITQDVSVLAKLAPPGA